MITISAEFRNVEGTQAALGWAGSHTIMIDRPEDRAGGMGLGFNGGQLLAMAIGGCFCNDLRYIADTMNKKLSELSVRVVIELEGDPLVTKSATMDVSVTMVDGSDPQPIINQAEATSMVSNSIARGIPVVIKSTTNPQKRPS